MRICEYIKYKRNLLGFSGEEMAERLGVTKQAVSKWERGIALPGIMLIPEMADLFGVSPELIMNFIWFGETGQPTEHFVHILVVDKEEDSFVTTSFSSKDFSPAGDKFIEICEGRNEKLMKTLLDFYTCAPSRHIVVELSEAIYDKEGEFPIKTQIIDSCELNSMLQSHLSEKE